MKIETFFYAIEIADTGSFSQAARNLYVSQPNLSHAIRQLEEKSGIQIFTRSSSGVVPTPEGRELIDRFRMIKREYEQVEELMASPIRQTRLTLRVATLNCSRTMTAFAAIAERYVDSPINFSFLNYSSLDTLLPVVEKGQVDFAIIGTLSPYVKTVINRLNNHSVEYHPLADAAVYAVVGPKNPLYHGPDNVRLRDLAPYVCIQYGSAEDAPTYSLNYETGLNHIARGEIHVSNSQMFYSFVERTTIVGLVTGNPPSAPQRPDLGRTRRLLVEDCSISAQFAWVKLRRMPLSDIAAELLQMLTLYF